MRLRPALWLWLAMVAQVAACIPHRDELAHAIEGARDIATVAAPCMVATKEAQQQACAGDAQCLKAVGAQWSRMADAMDRLHVAWCLLSPESEGCE